VANTLYSVIGEKSEGVFSAQGLTIVAEILYLALRSPASTSFMGAAAEAALAVIR
jgi:hypothetical protein